jgi:regulator of protease activity HflC (stomatin/prohibitin superfamily)
MNFVFILSLLFIVITGILAVVAVAVGKGKSSTSKSDAKVTIAFALVAGAFAILFMFLSSFTMVGTKDVGVVTSFGKTSGELSNGLHFIAPWEQVTSLDAAIQTDNHTGNTCISVRIANQQTACVDVSIRWRIRPKHADELYQNYHSFINLQDSLVTRELTSAVNNQLATYNPLNSVNLGTPSQGETPNPSLADVALSVTKQMRSEIGSQIEVLNTIIPIITFDPETQSRINQLQQQIALTRIAEQQIVTNTAQAQANNALARSVDTNTNVLVAQCLNILSTMVKNGQSVPVGFSCWPGSGSVGGVIVNGSATSTATGK